MICPGRTNGHHEESDPEASPGLLEDSDIEGSPRHLKDDSDLEDSPTLLKEASLSSSPHIKPAIVIREESTDTTCTLVDHVEELGSDEEVTRSGGDDVTRSGGDDVTRSGEAAPLNVRLLHSSQHLHGSSPSLVSDLSSECSEYELDLESEELNITDIAFAEDTDSQFVPTSNTDSFPDFEIDLNDEADDVTKTDDDDVTPATKPAPRSVHMSLRGASDVVRPRPTAGAPEIGCFGFRGEDYYRNCAHIVSEARQREKLRDYQGAGEMLKAAVEILIAGVQHDPDPIRREGVRRRTAEYLQIADNFAIQHKVQQQHTKPLTMTLAQVKALRVMSVSSKVVIVQTPKSGKIQALKTLRKPLSSAPSSALAGQSLVVRAPYLVQLLKYCVSENAVFLLLKRVQGSVVTEYVKRFKNTTPLPATLTTSGSAPHPQAPAPPDTSQLSIPGLAPRNLVKKWAAQLVICLSSLHRQGLVYADLHSHNVMIDDYSNVCLTYITQLPGLHHRVSNIATNEMFVAPEVLTGLHAVTPAADWWSLGALLFYLMSGRTLAQHFPYQALRSTKIKIDHEDQSGGSSLVSGLLKQNPAERLGGGVMGAEEIRSHFYFSSIKWDLLEKQQSLL